MKRDDDQNGLARVDQTAAANVPGPVARRDAPMKRGDRPTTEDLTPASLGGTAKVKAALANALRPVFEQMDEDEDATAWEVVRNLIPKAVARRSAQSEDRIADRIGTHAGEVVAESVATFQGVRDGNSAKLSSLVDPFLDELCPVYMAG